MEQIQNVGQVSFQANTMPTKQVEQTPAQATTNPIENGDEKSMSALQWAGVIGAATLAVGGIAYAAIRGKGIDSKYVKFDKAGKATYQKAADGSELGKITKWIKGIDDKGNIKSGKVVRKTEDGSKIITKMKDGVIAKQKKTGDSGFVKIFERDDKGRLTKMTQGDVTTTFEYNDKGRLVKKTVGTDTFEYKYNASGKLESISQNGKVKTANQYGVGKVDGKDKELLAEVSRFDKDGKKIADAEIDYSEKGIVSSVNKKENNSRIYASCDEKGVKKSVTIQTENKTDSGQEIIQKIKANNKELEIKSTDTLIEYSMDGKKISVSNDNEQGVFEFKYGDKTESIQMDEEGEAYNIALQTAFKEFFKLEDKQIEAFLNR